jgi:D-threo-aldose 1-dehydrogenase
VFNSGILAGGSTYDYQPAPQQLLDRRDAFASICDRYDVPLAVAALAFPLRHPAVTCVIVGARSPGEMAANVAAFERPLPEAVWEALP